MKNFLYILLIAISIGLILTNIKTKHRSQDNSALGSAHKEISSIKIDSPQSKNARAPKFLGIDTEFLNHTLESEALDAYKKGIETLNLSTNKNLWTRKVWNLNFFKDQNLPLIVGTIKNKTLFSSFYQNKGLRFLDLPIYMPTQGWRIPIELEQFKEVIKMALDHERICKPNFEKDHYVYITVDQGQVEPQTSQRRAGWHSDSYRRINNKKAQGKNILVDHVYVIYDNCPTVFAQGPFSLDSIDSNNINEVLASLNEQATTKEKKLYSNYTLLKMDPYCIHDAGINNTNKPINRTFVKLSFSKTKYRHLGNAHNNLFIYDWPMVPRKNVPYTKEALALSSHRKDRDSFLEIDCSEIDFEHKISNVSWASNNIQKVCKLSTIYAERAQEGDVIETKHNNSIATICIAEKGDYKVVYSPCDMWFLSESVFNELYEPILNKPNTYKLKNNQRYAVQLTQKVRMRAPWGTLAYAIPGDYLVYRTINDIYFVPKHLFEQTYKPI